MATSHLDVRRYPRRAVVSGRLPGRLVANDMIHDIAAGAVDVSPGGIGIVLKESLAPGEYVWLVIEDRVIKLTVRHCERRPDAKDQFLCGLSCGASWENIERLFAKLGCLEA